MSGGRSATHLVGRSAELAAIEEALDQGSLGSGFVLVLRGEAGMGKTALAGKMVEAAVHRGFEAFVGVARQETQDLPFGPAIEAFELNEGARGDATGVVRLLNSPAGLGGGQSRIVEGIVDLVEQRAQDRATVVLVEDLQWADPSTLALIERLAEVAEVLPCIITCSARTDCTPEVARTLNTLGARGTDLLLGPLHAADVEELVAARFSRAPGPALREMLSRADGNPFYVTELLEAADQDGMLSIGDVVDLTALIVPPSLALTVLTRLRAFSEGAVSILRSGAVLGSVFGLDELSALSGLSASKLAHTLEPVLRAGLLVDRDGRLAFHHDLVREVLYEDTPGPLRMALHVDAARILEERGASPAVVARHVRKSATPGDELAVSRLRRAAEAAIHRAPSVAVELLEQALSLASPSSQQRDALRVMHTHALAGAGRLEDAERGAKELLAERRGGARDRELLLTLAWSTYMRGLSHGLAEQLERSAQEDDATPAERAHLLAAAAVGRATERGRGGKGNLLDEASRWAEIADDDTARCRCLLAKAELNEGMLERVGLGRKAVELARAGDVDEGTAIDALMSLGLLLANFKEHRDEAVELLMAGLRRAEEAGIAWSLPVFHHSLGMARARDMSFDDAVVDFETAVKLARDTASNVVIAASAAMLGTIYLRRGDYANAENWIGQAEEAGADLSPWVRYETTLARALLVEAHEECEAALDLLVRSLSEHEEAGMLGVAISYGIPMARMAVEIGRRDASEMIVRTSSEAASRTPHPYARGIAEACRAIAEGDANAAVAALDTIRASGGLASSTAFAAEHAALLLASDGRKDEAKALLEEALAIWDGAGARREVRRLDAELRALGVRRGHGTRSRSATGWEAVTPAEQAVLELILEGLFYKEIAARLFISKRTVETHVTHLFQKLGAANRRELETLAREQRGS